MIHATVTSATRGPRTMTGEPRDIANKTENHMRDLAKSGIAFAISVTGPMDRLKETAMLRAYLHEVEQELRNDCQIQRAELQRAAKEMYRNG